MRAAIEHLEAMYLQALLMSVTLSSCLSCMDILVPFHVSDASLFLESGGLRSMRRHVKPYDRIYIVSASPDALVGELDEQTIWVNETQLSFKLSDFQNNGWRFQQAIKLLGPLEIPDLCEAFVVIDADVVFVKDVHLQHIDANGFKKYTYVYAHVVPWQVPTSLTGLNAILKKNLDGHGCAIHHQMVMQKDVLAELQAEISILHEGRSMLEVLQQLFDRESNYVSEYQLYFYFMLDNYYDRMHIVYMPYVHAHNVENCAPHTLQQYGVQSDVMYVACHDGYHEDWDDCINSVDGCSTAENINVPKQRQWLLCLPLKVAAHQMRAIGQ